MSDDLEEQVRKSWIPKPFIVIYPILVLIFAGTFLGALFLGGAEQIEIVDYHR